MEYDYRPLPEKIPDALIARAAKLSTPNLCDGLTKLKLNSADYTMDAAIRPVNDQMKIVATASTVDTKEGDNLPIHVAIYGCKPGYCLVVAGKAAEERAYMGDLMGGAANAIGVSGIIVDGYIRDKLGLDELKMPIFSRGYKPASPSKIGPGAINTEVGCGHVTVKPGDLIMADCDGIVCIPRDMIEAVLTKAEEKVAYEAGRVNAIANYAQCKAAGKELPDLTPGWVKDMLGSR